MQNKNRAQKMKCILTLLHDSIVQLVSGAVRV